MSKTLAQQLSDAEASIIAETLPQHRFLVSAAESLGIRYCTLYRKIRQHGIAT